MAPTRLAAGSRARISLCFMAFVAAVYPCSISAQTLGGMSNLSHATNRMNITTQDSLEWDDKNRSVTARGNVVLKYKADKIYSDEAIVYYRYTSDKRREFYLFLGNGNVRIVTAEYEIIGPKLRYDLIKGVAKMIGKSKVVSRAPTGNSKTIQPSP